MCGITGYISQNTNKQELENAVAEIKHRGPDAQALWQENDIGFGHARLSIIDLSQEANQPMLSHTGRFVMAYNGEVYNYQEIKNKYKIHTKTSSDSEVILELFAQKGASFVNELNGMFAIAIYDRQEKKLYLFRDRLGIKPLFYFFDGENFAFASEIKALFKYGFVKKQINKNTIADFLHLGYIPEPYSFFEDIFKFPTGGKAIIVNKKIQLDSYWQPESRVEKTSIDTFFDAKKKLQDLLFSSVEQRMIADVPLGTFLSGGIDSSLVTAVAQSLSGKPVKTFSIGFKESKFNESDYARKVAKYLKTDHHEFIVSEKEVLDLFDNFFDAYDEPFADSSGFPTMLVSKLAKQYVTVALSGDGGDELFHGYGMYNWANRLQNPAIKVFRKSIAFGLSKMDNRYKRIANLFQCDDNQRIKSHIFSQEQYFFSQKEINNFLLQSPDFLFDEKISTKRKLSAAEEQALFDIKYYLKDDLLVKVDRASMQSALEVRVPLLDHRIVEFALNLNPALKIKTKEQKYLLKQVLYDFVPKKYFDRPKWGFSIPLEKWLQTDLKYLLDKYTEKELVERCNVFDFQEVDSLKKAYLNGQTYLYNRLWLIMVLHKNLEKYTNE